MSKKSLFTGLAIGAVVGAGLTYLFGSDSGKKLQKDIKKKGKELAENIPQVDEIVDGAKETLDAVKDTVSEGVDIIKDKLEEPVSLPPKPRYFKKNN